MKNINDITYKIIGCAYEVHKILGPGLLESTYETCLCYELEKQGLKFEKQKELMINFSRRFYCARIKVSREFITYSYCSNFDIPQTF